MEKVIFEHRGSYIPQEPVLIFSKSTISASEKEIKGCIKVGDHKAKVGDIIKSIYIGSNATFNSPVTTWEIKAIKETFTPKGHFIVDVEKAGFIAIVTPYQENI